MTLDHMRHERVHDRDQSRNVIKGLPQPRGRTKGFDVDPQRFAGPREPLSSRRAATSASRRCAWTCSTRTRQARQFTWRAATVAAAAAAAANAAAAAAAAATAAAATAATAAAAATIAKRTSVLLQLPERVPKYAGQ